MQPICSAISGGGGAAAGGPTGGVEGEVVLALPGYPRSGPTGVAVQLQSTDRPVPEEHQAPASLEWGAGLLGPIRPDSASDPG